MSCIDACIHGWIHHGGKYQCDTRFRSTGNRRTDDGCATMDDTYSGDLTTPGWQNKEKS
ncbi:MAG: hypothetical protein REI95_01185 [Oxalicibacterium faecigallinarum]|uniref:hypothetical protein n=1 Tax=Oxalicibacterium faecigallinarum TaxID=573741 RepID=UPI002808C0A8|nr:hypothetical protein [Oxalicibacterium faecigallinarum]MDQ7968230.1 hypothetical protein [Oxalicibacterium faecigallinarum]